MNYYTLLWLISISSVTNPPSCSSSRFRMAMVRWMTVSRGQVGWGGSREWNRLRIWWVRLWKCSRLWRRGWKIGEYLERSIECRWGWRVSRFRVCINRVQGYQKCNERESMLSNFNIYSSVTDMQQALIIRLPDCQIVYIYLNLGSQTLNDLVLLLQKQTKMHYRAIQLLHNNNKLVSHRTLHQSLTSLNLQHEDILTMTSQQFMISMIGLDKNIWKYDFNAASGTLDDLFVFVEQKTGLPRQRVLLTLFKDQLNNQNMEKKLIDLGMYDGIWVQVSVKEEKNKTLADHVSEIPILSLGVMGMPFVMLVKMTGLLYRTMTQ